MAKPIEIVCVLDRSGSMASLVTEVINSFNVFLKEQKAEPGKARLTLVIFDDHYDIIHDRVKLSDVPGITPDVYFARGMTALNDAIGKTIAAVKKGAEKVIFLIQTDGHENASSEYSASDIKKLVEKKQKKGWEFLFVGAGIDAFDVGGAIGIPVHNIAMVAHTASGVRDTYSTMTASTLSYRRGSSSKDDKKVSNTVAAN